MKKIFFLCFYLLFPLFLAIGQESFNLQKAKEIYRSYPDSARSIANKALENAANNNDLELKAQSHIYIGLSYHIQGAYDNGYKQFNEAMRLYDSLGNTAGYARVLNLIGSVYRKQGNYAESLKYYKEALKIEEELGHKTGISKNLNNIGDSYRKMKEFEKALGIYNNSLSIDLEEKNIEGCCR